MEEGMGHSRGSMNPWAESEEYLTKPNWNKINEFETPFGAMAELLQTWPGTSQTSEQNADERHLRLVSVISGYPEIQTGRRPLDIPLHNKSKLAFKLSNFIDQVAVTQSKHDISEWHSLRTYMMHYDLMNSAHMEKEKFIHFFIRNLRNNSTFENQNYPEDKLHDEEVRFLTVLHSQSDSRKAYWPVQDKCLEFKEDLKMTLIKLNAGPDTYIEHEFKFDKIHKWIKKWGSPKIPEMLEKNITQKWVVATSSILESIFAKLRSHIVKEKRPGSIIIDGGGRISFISKKSSEEEQLWFRKILLEAFLINPDNPHPFDDLITSKLKDYGNKNNRNESIIGMIESQLPEKHERLWRLDKETNVWSLTRDFYEEVIGEKSAIHFLPRVVIGFEEDGSEKYLYEEEEVKSWHFSECIFCKGTAVKPEKKKMKVKDYVKSGHYVCPFHYMFRYWADRVDIRHSSNPDLFSQQPVVSAGKNINHILVFDGNSIGLIFTKHFSGYNTPSIPDAAKIWDEEKEKILDIKIPWHYDWKEDSVDINTKEAVKLKSRVKNCLYGRRLQPLIRKQRRSFNFNVEWWLSLREALQDSEDCNLRPWILAGDDVVFASKPGTSEQSIMRMLEKFQSNLSTIKGITFAGGLQTRNSESIIDCFHSAKQLEAFASLVWKKFASQNFPNLIDEKKKANLEQEWGKEQIHSELFTWLENEGSTRFKFAAENEAFSIIIPSNWKDYSSS